MVQYAITPWRSQSELLQVRGALYPPTETPTTISARTKAVALVSVWMQRGGCPHRVESTALLTSALLTDVPSNSPYAVRAVYAAAFGRFVTGLLDNHQVGKKKLSMYTIASNIGLEASFVELRHQCVHEALPSLARLRQAARKSLDWLWENYWAGLSDERGILRAGRGEEVCRKVVKEYLRWGTTGQIHDKRKRMEFRDRIKGFNERVVLDVLLELGDSIDGASILQSRKLAKAICSGEVVQEDESLNMEMEDAESGVEEEIDLVTIRAEMEKQKAVLNNTMESDQVASFRSESPVPTITATLEGMDNCGWGVWQGLWLSKPIGMV